jgi:hypothetical protein
VRAVSTASSTVLRRPSTGTERRDEYARNRRTRVESDGSTRLTAASAAAVQRGAVAVIARAVDDS